MSEVMRAFQLRAWGQAPEQVEVPVPHAGPGQVVVEVAGCGVCHSDVGMAAMPAEVGEALGWSIPFTLGHETAGRIVELGDGVDGWAEGDPVALASPASCGTCHWCVLGHESSCAEGLVGRGYGRDGGLAERVLVRDVRGLVALRSGDHVLDPAVAGPLTDAGATAWHAVRRLLGRSPANDATVVIGTGGLGLFAIQALRWATGSTIIAVDPDPVRRSLALERGAHHAVDGVERGTRRALREIAGGPVGAVLDFVGTDDTIACAIAVLEARGAFGLVGASGGTLRKPWYGTLPRDGEVFTFQGSDLADVRQVVELAAQGIVTVDVVPWALDDAAGALAALDAGGLAGRIVVRP
ncbi:MAG: alcohol dehydrogenase catalytic domain-containing protein [Acidimicrobiales bacterium]